MAKKIQLTLNFLDLHQEKNNFLQSKFEMHQKLKFVKIIMIYIIWISCFSWKQKALNFSFIKAEIDITFLTWKLFWAFKNY